MYWQRILDNQVTSVQCSSGFMDLAFIYLLLVGSVKLYYTVPFVIMSTFTAKAKD